MKIIFFLIFIFAFCSTIASSNELIPSNPVSQGLALLTQAEKDSTRAITIQYQLDNLIRSSASEISAPEILDSLTFQFHPTTFSTAEILENLCWSNRNLKCAYQNILSQQKFRKLSPPLWLDKIGRFFSSGYVDYAYTLLEQSHWKTFSSNYKIVARSFYFELAMQLKNWNDIDSEMNVTSRLPDDKLTDELEYIGALAQVKLSKSAQALAPLNRLEKNAAAPWSYRARILKSQALMALGKGEEANQTLEILKHDPHRQEGTGPILFWQACLALEQKRFHSAESLLVLSSAYTGSEEAQRALEYRFFLLQDTTAPRTHFFRALSEAPHSSSEKLRSLDLVPISSKLWPFARLEKAQILTQVGLLDSAEQILNEVSLKSPDRLAGLAAEAKAAFLQEKFPGGKAAALVRYEDLLIKYQQGVIPEFSRGRIKALK